MFSAKSAFISAALGCAGLALVAPAAAEAGVVIKSSGPSASEYPVGKKLNDRGRITLKAGDSVTVLANGRTRVIKGAGTHRVAARGTSKRSTFAALTTQRSNARARVGATRGDLAGSSSKSRLWDVDVTKAGTICVVDFDAVRMWRPNNETAASYVVKSEDSPEDVHVSFSEGIALVPWDGTRMPLSDGVTYDIAVIEGGEAVAVSFAKLDTMPETPEDMASALIEKGCTGQLDLLAAKMM